MPLVNPAKKSTNITLSAEVLTEVKAMGINISQPCDQFLRECVSSDRSEGWQEDHVEFVAAYNKTVAAEGLPLEQWRSF